EVPAPPGSGSTGCSTSCRAKRARSSFMRRSARRARPASRFRSRDVGGSLMMTVLLLHAGIADSRMWQPQVGPLEAAGYRVIAPDLRGFGERPLEPAPFS